MAKYTAVIEGTSGGERREFTAKSRGAAEKKIKAWVREGSYDEPGSVVVWIHGPDGTMPLTVTVDPN